MEDLKLKILKEELDYIVNYNPDPKLSEINIVIPDLVDEYYGDDINKLELVLYKDIAWFLDKELKENSEPIHEMYRDIILNKKVGFIYAL